MEHNAIELSGLTKRYADFALGPVNLTLPGGAILGLVGENGAGRTTLIKTMLGVARPDGGTVRLLGQEAEQAKADIGVVLEDCFFYEGLHPRDVGRVLGGVYPTWDGALFESYLNQFGLADKKSIRALSRGMRMKLSLAAALAHRPRLLLLDEATAGLDPVVRDEILDEFLAFACDEQHSILISSHITSDLEKAADYIAYLHQGKLLLCEEKDRLLEEYGRLVCSEAELSAVDASFLAGVRRGKFSCEALVKHRARFAAAYPHLTVERVGLDDIMVFINRAEKEREAEA